MSFTAPSLPSRRFGLDSSSEVAVSAHHAVGSSVALRYLGHNTGKVITRAEHQRYIAAHIDLVLVFEDFGRPDRSDYPGGKADAEFAIKQATGILGTPMRDARIRFAADYDPAGHPELADPYFDGVAAVLDRAASGPYGNDQMLAHQHARGFRSLWQTYAWSGGRFYSSVDTTAFQYSNGHVVGGVDVDFNHLYGADFGQYDYRPPIVDPHHYQWFHRPDIRQAVIRYDQIRPHPRLHARELHGLQVKLRAGAGDVYDNAHAQGDRPAQVAAGWNRDHNGWKYQELIKRAQGERRV